MNTTDIELKTLEELMKAAASKRDRIFGRRITYSPKVFIPLTMLCQDKCGYCKLVKMLCKQHNIAMDIRDLTENPKQLEELDESSCKWPIGHPDEKLFYFCGRSSLKDFSYCKLHLLYAYQPKGKKEEPTEKEEVPDFIEKKIQSA